MIQDSSQRLLLANVDCIESRDILVSEPERVVISTVIEQRGVECLAHWV